MTTLEQTISKDYCMENNTDPKGNQWGVTHIKGSALYEVKRVKGTAINKPENCEGRFTKPDLAMKEIKKYLEQAWQKNEEVSKRNERKAHKEKVEAKEDSAASTG